MYRPGYEESDSFHGHNTKFTRRGPSLLDEYSVSPNTNESLSSSSKSLPSRRSPSLLRSNERKHYNRALKEMCKILSLEGQKLEESQLAEDFNEINYHHNSVFRTKDDQRTLHNDTDIDINSRTSSLNEEDDTSFTPGSQKRPKHQRRKPRLVDNESSLEEEDETPAHLSQKSIQAVYAELTSISKKLQEESAVLHDRERSLQDREQALEERQQVLEEQIEASFTEQDKAKHHARKELMRRYAILQQEHQAEITKMDEILKEKTRENKRVKTSFDTLKQANDVLRQQLDELQAQNKKLETQAVSVQHRLTNLQRRQELTERHRTMDIVSANAKAETQRTLAKEMGESKTNRGQQTAKASSQVYSVLGSLLEWISDVHLMHISKDPSTPVDSLPVPALTHDRCIKVLPSLVEILHSLPTISAVKIHLPCLQFIYWSIMHIEMDQGSQRTSLSATYRRLGEELYKPTIVKCSSDDGKDLMGVSTTGERSKAAVLYKSPNLHIRFLSSLIILRTLTQVDYLAQVFDTLRSDLKDERAKVLFLTYHGTQVIIPHMKATNRAQISSAVDICLLMSVESMVMQPFIDSCSIETWFRACSTMLHAPKLDVKVWEKLSIVLQKLSKIKSNKKYFEVLGIGSAVQEMIRTAGPENAFLGLNLRSILFNLSSGKVSPQLQTHP